MCATLTKFAAAVALIGALALSAIAISLTVGSAADACQINAQHSIDKLVAPATQGSGTLTIFDRDCLDWHPAG